MKALWHSQGTVPDIWVITGWTTGWFPATLNSSEPWHTCSRLAWGHIITYLLAPFYLLFDLQGSNFIWKTPNFFYEHKMRKALKNICLTNLKWVLAYWCSCSYIASPAFQIITYKKQNASNALVWAKMRLVTLWEFAALCSCFRPCSWLCLLLCPLTAFLHLDCSSCTPNIIQELGTAFQPGSAPASVVTYSWHPTPSWKQSMRHPGECHALPSEYWFSYFHLKKTIGCILPRSVGIS